MTSDNHSTDVAGKLLSFYDALARVIPDDRAADVAESIRALLEAHTNVITGNQERLLEAVQSVAQTIGGVRRDGDDRAQHLRDIEHHIAIIQDRLHAASNRDMAHDEMLHEQAALNTLQDDQIAALRKTLEQLMERFNRHDARIKRLEERELEA
jgi:hypothetical protein